MFTFGKKTVAGAVAAFNKIMDELTEVEAIQQAEAVRQADIISSARQAHDASVREAAQAREVRAKIAALIDIPKVEVGNHAHVFQSAAFEAAAR